MSRDFGITQIESRQRLESRNSPGGIRGNLVRCAWWLLVAVLTCSTLVASPLSRSARAQTFNDAINAQLEWDGARFGCARLVGGSPRDTNADSPTFGQPLEFGPELADICGEVRPGPGPTSNSSAGSGVATVSPTVMRRLRRLGEEEEDAGGGASADAEVGLGSGFSVFLSGDYEDLDRNRTAFEDGYDSDIWGVTLGADYLFGKSVVAGLAFNFKRWDGDFDTGGGFENDYYGAIAYASFLPLERLFIDLSLGYSRIDVSEDRRRFYENEEGTQFGGRVDSDRDDNEFSGLLQLGYDFSLRQFTFGPRLALDWKYTDIDSYTEKGSTGLELKYDDDDETSVQSRVGLQASMAISTRFGVILPQLNADWIHEFSDDRRSTSVQFVQDFRDNPGKFTFQNDSPDENFYELGASIALVLPRGFQAFANVRRIQEHQYFDSTAGTVGVRFDF
ncbi:MAG: autotransporter outer membrane beta-barrel domain-containing protein [Gammaproteobacteria bacterium]|nr:autotransporter outer membrane beta-barrel domain-containing protein [Gammaproteobacteria bacterium]